MFLGKDRDSCCLLVVPSSIACFVVTLVCGSEAEHAVLVLVWLVCGSEAEHAVLVLVWLVCGSEAEHAVLVLVWLVCGSEAEHAVLVWFGRQAVVHHSMPVSILLTY